MLEENATSRRARPHDRRPFPGAARSAAGGDAAGKPTRAAAARRRRRGRRTPPAPTPRRIRSGTRRAAPGSPARPGAAPRCLLVPSSSAAARFPAVSLGCHPAGLLLAAGTRRAPKRGQRRRLAHNEIGTPAARGAARPSHSWIRSGEPWGTDRAGGQTSRHGEATRPEAAAAAALGPSGRAPHLANDGKRTGEEATRA